MYNDNRMETDVEFVMTQDFGTESIRTSINRTSSHFDVGELCEMFQDFLAGAGYHIDGTIGILDEEY